MDASALTLCMENHIPILVFNLHTPAISIRPSPARNRHADKQGYMQEKISAIKQHQDAAAALAADHSSIKAIVEALAKTALSGGRSFAATAPPPTVSIAGELVGASEGAPRHSRGSPHHGHRDPDLPRQRLRLRPGLRAPGGSLAARRPALAISIPTSPNVLRAAVKAREIGMQVVGFEAGRRHPPIAAWPSWPRCRHPRVQEMHIRGPYNLRTAEDAVAAA